MTYRPGPIGYPEDFRELGRYLEDELDRVGEESREPSPVTVRLDVLNNPPDKPANGTIAYADGTNWNPGSGEGFYGYENGSWVKL
jgi:hypothetical protein